jgi:hypothetical protein
MGGKLCCCKKEIIDDKSINISIDSLNASDISFQSNTRETMESHHNKLSTNFRESGEFPEIIDNILASKEEYNVEIQNNINKIILKYFNTIKQYVKINNNKIQANTFIRNGDYYIVENKKELFIVKCINKATRMADMKKLCYTKNNMDYIFFTLDDSHGFGYDFIDHFNCIESSRWGSYIPSNIYLITE